MKQAKTAVLTGINEPFEIREYPIVSAPKGMAMMELVASGICGTDIHIHRGKIPTNTPRVIGHEFVGKVADIAEEDSTKYGVKKGDNVIVDIACPCGECDLCKEGDDANCVNMGVTNGADVEVAPHFYGGFSEVNYSPVENLIKIPQDLDPKMTSVFACAGPTGLHAFALAERANVDIKKVKVAVVQGLGPVGTFAVMYLAAIGVKNVIAITMGNNKDREDLAIKLGATKVCNLEKMTEEELLSYIKQLNPLGADLVFEASGSPKAVGQGLKMLRNRGVYLVPGQYSNSGKAEIDPQLITFNALHIIGSSQYSVSDVKHYIEFLQNNRQLHSCINSLCSCYKVEQINEAFDDAKSGKNIKTLLVK